RQEERRGGAHERRRERGPPEGMDIIVAVEGPNLIAGGGEIEAWTVVGEVRARPRTVDRRNRYDVGQPGGVVEGRRPGVARRGDDQGALGPRVVDRELDVRRAAERLVRAEGEV